MKINETIHLLFDFFFLFSQNKKSTLISMHCHRLSSVLESFFFPAGSLCLMMVKAGWWSIHFTALPGDNPNEEEKSRPTLSWFLRRKNYPLVPDGTWYVTLHTFNKFG